MTPGAYLRVRRQAAGLSLDDVAVRLAVEPAYPAMSRAEWLAAMEEDIAPVAPDTARALRQVFAFDLIVLDRIANGMPVEICRGCACSWYDACETKHGGCYWVEVDLCSVCAAEAKARAAVLVSAAA